MAQFLCESLAEFARRMLAASLVLLFAVAASPARADIDIEITGVDGQVRANVLAYLSLERFKTRDKLQEDTVERLHARSEREVKAALRPFGYYEPTIESSIEPEGNGRDWRVRVRVDAGRPVLLEEVKVRITGPRADDPVFKELLANMPLREGARLEHATYDQFKANLQRSAAGYGYLDGRLTRRELLVDPPNYRASVFIDFETGERYQFGATEIDQSVIRPELVRRFLRYREGQPFDAGELLRTQFALDDSQYFSTVEVAAQERDKSSLTVPVKITTQPNRRNRYTAGFGYATDTRFRVTATWENRRVNDRGHRFRIEAKGAEVNQQFTARYIWPIGDPALEKFEFEFNTERTEPGDIETRTVEVRPSITNVLGRWQRVLYTRYAYTETIDDGQNSQLLLIPGITYASVPRGYLGEALFGRALSTELRGSGKALGAGTNYAQIIIASERVFNFAPAWHLLLQGEVAATSAEDFRGVPGTERFFAGGDNSVRGFGFNEISPSTPKIDPATGEPQIDPETGNVVTEKTGGQHRLLATVEVIRELPKNLGMAVFVDAGGAFNSFSDLDPFEYSAGIGVRLRLPVVTLGIDVAQPLSQSGAGPRLHLNFSPKL